MRECARQYNFSADTLYSFGFRHVWDATLPIVGFICHHPGLCVFEHDRELRLCEGYAEAQLCGGVMVAYLLPKRTLRYQRQDEMGEISSSDLIKSQCGIYDLFDVCSKVIAAWGSMDAGAPCIAEILRGLKSIGYGNTLYHLGLTKDGEPKSMDRVTPKSKAKRWAF